MDEVRRALPGDRRQRRQVHQQRAVAVEHDDTALREGEREPEPDRRAQPERLDLEMAVGAPDRRPLRARATVVGHDELVVEQRRDGRHALESLHVANLRRTDFVSRTATGRDAYRLSFTASGMIERAAAESAGKNERIPRPRRTGSVTSPRRMNAVSPR